MENEAYPNIVFLTSDRYYSPTEYLIVQECWNGLCLEKTSFNSWKVLSISHFLIPTFPCDLSQLNWDPQKFLLLEKIDGIFVNMFYHENQWKISTISSWDSLSQPLEFTSKSNYHVYLKPYGSLLPEEKEISLTNLFWKLWKELNYQFPTEINLCFQFQFVSKHFPCITQYPQDTIILHGVKDRVLLEEIDFLEVANKYNWKAPTILQCYSNFDSKALLSFSTSPNFRLDLVQEPSPIQEIWEQIKQLDPVKCEGFIIYDTQSKFRLSIPSPQFLILQKLEKENTTFWNADHRTNERLMIDLIRTNPHKEFLQYFPRWKPLYESIQSTIHSMAQRFISTYHEIEHLSTQAFGKEARRYSFYGILYELREMLQGKKKEMKIEEAVQLLLRDALLKRVIQLIEEFQKETKFLLSKK